MACLETSDHFRNFVDIVLASLSLDAGHGESPSLLVPLYPIIILTFSYVLDGFPFV